MTFVVWSYYEKSDFGTYFPIKIYESKKQAEKWEARFIEGFEHRVCEGVLINGPLACVIIKDGAPIYRVMAMLEGEKEERLIKAYFHKETAIRKQKDNQQYVLDRINEGWTQVMTISIRETVLDYRKYEFPDDQTLSLVLGDD